MNQENLFEDTDVKEVNAEESTVDESNVDTDTIDESDVTKEPVEDYSTSNEYVTTEETKTEKKKGSVLGWVMVVLVVALLALICVVIFRPKDEETTQDTPLFMNGGVSGEFDTTVSTEYDDTSITEYSMVPDLPFENIWVEIINDTYLYNEPNIVSDRKQVLKKGDLYPCLFDVEVNGVYAGWTYIRVGESVDSVQGFLNMKDASYVVEDSFDLENITIPEGYLSGDFSVDDVISSGNSQSDSTSNSTVIDMDRYNELLEEYKQRIEEEENAEEDDEEDWMAEFLADNPNYGVEENYDEDDSEDEYYEDYTDYSEESYFE